MKNIKEKIKKIVPLFILKFICKLIIYPLKKHYRKSYAQCGEDVILDVIFNSTLKGVYVDVGANHPINSNNTYLFYNKGWKGINIDAMPGSMKLFNKYRKRDINLEFPINDVDKTMNYYMYKQNSYNSFIENSTEYLQHLLIGTKQLQTKKLSWILDTYLSSTNIDFLTVDVEGMDFNVLKSNNWEKYRPKVVLFESLVYENNKEGLNYINNYLQEKGYSKFCCTPTNVFYIEKTFLKQRFNN